MNIKFLRANNGDAILISFNDNAVPVNILIDGGTGNSYLYKSKRKMEAGALQTEINRLKAKGEKIDLLIMTHIDDDHIGGILRWIEEDTAALGMISKVWFNSGKMIDEWLQAGGQEVFREIPVQQSDTTNTGVEQGVTFEKLIRDAGIWDGQVISQGDCLVFRGLVFKILSPSVRNLEDLLKKWKEDAPESLTADGRDYKVPLETHLAHIISNPDDATHNGSSIAFLLSYGDKEMLFLGDAHAETITEGLSNFHYSVARPVNVEFMKLSHHGSNRNISEARLDLVNTDTFIISSDGGRYGLPDKHCLARIIKAKPGPLLLFNYPERAEEVFTAEDRQFISFFTAGLDGGILIK